MCAALKHKIAERLYVEHESSQKWLFKLDTGAMINTEDYCGRCETVRRVGPSRLC